MRNITCIEDLRELARHKIPRSFFDYAEAGSYSQETLRAKIEPDVAVESFRNVYPYKHDEDADPWIDSLRKAGLPEG